MDFLQELGSHRGGLIRLKSELFWYDGRGWDGIRGRVCLLMDARDAALRDHASTASVALGAATAAFLLVDGEPHWVWVAPADVELLS